MKYLPPPSDSTRLHNPGYSLSFTASFRRWLAGICVLASLVGLPEAKALVTFQFVYTDAPNAGFNDPAHPEYKASLVRAGEIMGSFFANNATITMSVRGTSRPKSEVLASAGSSTISPMGDPGFFRTVVQEKVISSGANDLNGDQPDGEVDVNLGASFQFNADAPVAEGQIDFVGTMIHELTHAFGFSSSLVQTPNEQPVILSIFDSFLVDGTGETLVNPTKFIFRSAKQATLTGGNSTIMDAPSPGGVFFAGPNAVAANGGQPVAIFAPTPYQTGSSISHLDDNTAALKPLLMAAAAEANDAAKIMAGIKMARAYGVIERGIMTDLGYTLNP